MARSVIGMFLDRFQTKEKLQSTNTALESWASPPTAVLVPVGINVSIPPGCGSLPQLNENDYPHVKFWHRDVWKEYRKRNPNPKSTGSGDQDINETM